MEIDQGNNPIFKIISNVFKFTEYSLKYVSKRKGTNSCSEMRLPTTNYNSLIFKPGICSHSNTHNIAISLVVVRVVFTIVLQLLHNWAKNIIKLHLGTGSPLLTRFFETLAKQHKQKTV